MSSNSMKDSIKKTLILIIITVAIIPSLSLVYAQTAEVQDYTVLTSLPGIETSPGKTNLERYLPGAFNLAVGIALGLAFVVITFGGVMYATSDAISGKSQGKEYIQNALWGLLLVISSYVILYTLNPKILNFELIFRRPPQVEVTYPTPTTTCPDCVVIADNIPIKAGAGTQISSAMLPKLVALNIALNNSGIPWRINEAYPPTTTHRDPCHRNGTCIDARPINQTPANLSVFAAAARSAGLRPVYEVATEGDRLSLISSKPPPTGVNIIVVPGINGAHFSVYNQ